jgi:2-keto-4-pentenoate hydratase
VGDVVSTLLHQELADELWDADRSTKPVTPLTERHPDLVISDAYAIQSINIARRVVAGERVIGRKVGLTSRPMQQLLGVDEPDFGVLTDEMIVEDGDLIDLDRLVQPRGWRPSWRS